MTTTDKPDPTEAKVVPAKLVKASAQPINLHRLIRCLEEVEQGQWNHVGGKLCISRALWHDHGGRFNYRQASDPSVAREVAARALTHYIAELLALNHEPTVQMLAKCWNMGWSGAMGHLQAKSDYAERVNNLYTDTTWEPKHD